MGDLDDLFIRVEPARADSLLSDWSWHPDQSFRPIVLSLFGDWLLEDESGNIHMLDLVSGDVKEIGGNGVGDTKVLLIPFNKSVL